MAAPQGFIRTHQCEQKLLFCVEGWAQMNLGLAVRRLAEQSLARGTTTLLMDLRQCVYMDSTFVGTMLFLQRVLTKRQCGELVLISPSRQCCELLEQMGLQDVFPVRSEEALATENWTLLHADLTDVDAFQRNVLQAHVELANLPGAAGAPFKKLVKLMAEEMEPKNIDK